ncbi:hypothetical protein PTSG_01272 [Salpingoeca rosetta]|uniref:Uncharacterized protein n=1 Tax=Salpingoeca rosetta (strain ATCC 50818 / BSB-021) TaxID=946362 RepID=F2TZV4_SALR5|nr:uncharacterized protein PTSG_01272 [Salpingoeca rosetta]EGD80682.1 hypothetical protein PTSG_01272 [Salpingoeca rosetta]|eukprot:XP_004997243.1 hypothetical protein PTSG_01272 [Salpingoeca rosetta]
MSKQLAVRSLDLLGRVQTQTATKKDVVNTRLGTLQLRKTKKKKQRRKELKRRVDHQQVAYEETQARLAQLKDELAGKKKSNNKATTKGARQKKARGKGSSQGGAAARNIESVKKALRALEARASRGAPKKAEPGINWDDYSVFKGLDMSQGILPYLKP